MIVASLIRMGIVLVLCIVAPCIAPFLLIPYIVWLISGLSSSEDFRRQGLLQKTDFSRKQFYVYNNSGVLTGPCSINQIQDFLKQGLLQKTDLSHKQIYVYNNSGEQAGPYSINHIQDFLRQRLV